MRFVPLVGALGRDLRYAVRQLARERALTALTVLVLALGVGAATAVYSVVDTVLLHTLPYPTADRLVALRDADGAAGQGAALPVSYPEVVAWQARAAAGGLAGVGAYFTTSAAFTGAGEAESLKGVRLSAELPGMLGVAPLVGRGFRPGEDRPQAERVVMLGEAFWRRRFGGDPGVVGRAITLDGHQWVVVGVTPRGARARLPAEFAAAADADYWMPLRLDDTRVAPDLHFLDVVGLVRPGLSVRDAGRQLAGAVGAVPQPDGTRHVVLTEPLQSRVVAGVRPLLALLTAAVATLLLVACANVATLLLARVAARRRELAVRTALGAGRARLVGQLLTESVLRALVGGAAGAALAYAILAGVHRFLPVQLPRFGDVTLNGRVLAVALLGSTATGLLFGLAPALRGLREGTAAVVRAGGRGVVGRATRDRVRASLVAGEVALSFVLLVSAGLLLRGFDRLLRVPTGFEAAQVVTAHVTLPSARYGDSTRQVAFYDQLTARLRAVPGVQGAALASNLPVEGGTSGGFGIEGYAEAPGGRPQAEKRIVSADYFGVLRARLVAGRFFDARDVAGAPAVVVINRALARRYFPGRDPQAVLGRRVDFAWDTQGLQTVVGVVADLKEEALDRPASPALYIPMAQRPLNNAYLLVRAAADPAGLTAALRREVRALDPAMPLAQVRVLDEVVTGGLSQVRVSTSVVGAFATVALALAAAGLFGVVSYAVAQRTRELGVRLALGARPADARRLVLAQALGPAVVGLGLGVVGALAVTRLLASQLFGVSSADPATYAAVATLLAGVAAAAALVPARRATRVDPVVALRAE